MHTYVPGGGIIIAKTKSTTRKKTKMTKRKASTLTDSEQIITIRDVSTTSRLDESGKITSISKVSTPMGERISVGLTTEHECKTGEKLSNRSSGKGIVACCTNQEDLPFSLETGCVCDLYISSVSPSARMTLSSLLECLVGKAVCLSGNLKYGIDNQDLSGSNHTIEQQCSALLREYGFSCRGTETFVCGKSGKILRARIFSGFVEASRLAHIASKKIHARGYEMGPRDPLTRQPKSGKINGGIFLFLCACI